MSPNDLHLLLRQGVQPSARDQLFDIPPATATSADQAVAMADDNADNDATNLENVTWDDIAALWHHTQMNGYDAIPGLGGGGGEVIQETPQGQLPTTAFVPVDGKEEELKEEEVKAEEQLATQVPEYVPLPPLEMEMVPPEPLVLGIGEIPPGYETKLDRRDLLDRTVRKLSDGNEGIRFDLFTNNAKQFINGEIEGLFESHLLGAAHSEVRNVNKRTRRRKNRNHRSMMKKWIKSRHSSSSGGSSSRK